MLVLKLASTPNPQEKPKVSKLPLPVSDSPLVIDLPDGQKIVIGKMTQGSVIEVATWRGVGRPDSRTSRLMLGVGSGNVEEDSDSSHSAKQEDSKKLSKPQDWRVVLFYIAQAINFLQNFPWKKLLSSASGAVKRKPKKMRNQNSSAVAENSVRDSSIISQDHSDSKMAKMDDDIEAWLNKISEKASQQSSSSISTTKKSVKKVTPVKKTVKKTATPRAKRK